MHTGDNVNLASRLQGLNKTYGTSILISRTVERLVADEFLIRPLDRVAVKGKSKVRSTKQRGRVSLPSLCVAKKAHVRLRLRERECVCV
jgi:class 3 adenylate cyclase